MRIRVYFNLHKNKFSIQAKTERGWRVVDHRTFVFLKNVKFIVNERLRQKVIVERKKNVHAFIEGDLIPPEKYNSVPWSPMDAIDIFYNPYLHPQFFQWYGDDEPSRSSVTSAKYASLQVNICSGKPKIYCEL